MTAAIEQAFAAGQPPLLEVEGLRTHFRTPRGVLRAVDGVNLRVARGEILGIVGESGSGKSVLAQSIVRVVPPAQLALAQGAVRFDGVDLMALDNEAMRALRGARIAMVTQNPSTALNPVFQVRSQMLETWRFHPDRRRTGIDAESRMLELLAEVQLPAPERVARSYPFQLSGGMKQRVAIAMALMGEPELLIADEPTTALDVTIQAQILELIRDLQQLRQGSMLLITHDLGVVGEVCDEVVIMYAGRIVERGTADQIFDEPTHPYTRGLMGSLPAHALQGQTLQSIPGTVPSVERFASGCRFAPRCSLRSAQCDQQAPPLIERSPGHAVACWAQD
jgi:oligopeptide/dipeptide ABC transporter ATP-binding protein